MATESPIRMVLPRGKWSSHPGTGKYMSSPRSESTDENRVLSRSQYQSGRCNAPNRSGSAPPSMEGSFASLENFMHSVRRSSSLIDGCDNSLNLPWGLLPTHKEESEDDKSPRHVHNDWTGRSPLWSTQNLPVTRQRGIVDQKLEDLSHTPLASDQQHSYSGSAEVADHNAASDLHVDTVTSSHDDDDISDASASRSISHAKMKSTISSGYNDDQSSEDNHKEDEGMAGGASEIASVQSGIKALKMSPASNRDIHYSQEEQQPIYQDSSVQHQPYQQNTILQFQNLVPHIASQVTSNAYVDTNHISHLGKISAGVQSVFHSSGTTPTLHAAPASYLPSANPYYSGMQLPGVMYSPQYGLGGYGFNPMMFPPYIPGYPPHSAVPYNFNSVSVPQYNPQTPGVSPSNHADTENLSKFYGQHINHHSFANPHMQFFPPYGDFYVGQVDPLAYSPGRSQGNTLISNERPDFSGASTVHGPLNQGASGSANLNQRKDFMTPGYFRSSSNMGVLQIPTSNLPGPILPPSPVGSTNLPYGRNELSSPHDSSRSASFYAGWTGQRGYENQNHTKPYSFLEELKSGKGRRLQISDVVGHVAEFSVDQHGSRFIQQKLENCSPEDKASVFIEVLPHASKLMTDVFGNYVIQKFFEYGMPEQRKELANKLQGQILPLSLQMYGCRVIQKALEVVEPEQKVELVHELDGHVLRCVRDQNGNHVIQKCIECIPIEKIDFIMSAFHGQVATLSMHPYGCRVIQRVLEHCANGSQSQFIVDEILESVCTLAQNQYGNYVTQHVLARGKPGERIQIIRKLAGQVVKMSQHKFASNVVEKCLKYGDSEGRELIIDEIIGVNESNDNLLIMMKDQYANYVVQKALEVCTDSQRELLLERIKVHLSALRKYTYGKHIVARFEQLFGQDNDAYGSLDS